MKSIVRQASIRLLASLVLLVLAIGLGTAAIYRVALHKAAAARAEELASFYGARLAQLDRDWEQQTRDFRVRLETTRLLERQAAVTDLQAFMTVQGSNRRFQYIHIEDRSGRKVFAYGRALDPEHIPTAPGDTRGWYADRDSGNLYRVLVEPIWLGRAGNGRMATFFPVDHATMGQLASPGIRLTAFHHQAPVASSLGQRGLDEASAGPADAEVRDIPWGDPLETATRLRIEAPAAALFSTAELALSLGAMPLAVGLILWLVVGAWLIRQARRVDTLGRAVTEFPRQGELTERVQERLAAAAGADEIGAVACTLRDVAERQALDTRQRKDEEGWRQLWAMVFANSHEAVVITDRDCRILSVNAAFTQLTGYSEAEALGRNPRILSSGCEGPAFYAGMWASIVDSGRWSGEIIDRRKDGSTYPKWLDIVAVRDGQDCVSHYIGIFADISEKKRAEEHFAFRSTHDTLTGLPNRGLLLDRLAAAIRLCDCRGLSVALLLLDLDNVKWVNDSLGHAAGDRLIVAVAERLKGALRDVDTLARLGGDEFVVLVQEPEGLGEIGALAQRLIDAVARPVDLDGIEVQVTASVGVSLFPNDGRDPAELLRHANAAMYVARNAGRNECRYFDPAKNADARERMDLEVELRQAVKRGEFELFYQPQLHAASGALRCAEALVRWHRPQRGLTLPDAFIALAEETGVVVPLGQWIIRSACEQLAAWARAGRPLCRIAINLSASQVESNAFVNSVRAIIEETGVAPELLEFELTESVVMRNPEHSIETLRQLRGLGLRLALDDFGTGYSSLSYLKRLPIDVIKIDRSFVDGLPDDPDDARIVQMIVALSKACSLEVVAEGIGNERQRAFLDALGCDYLQGYLIARPMPAIELAERLAEAAASRAGAAA